MTETIFPEKRTRSQLNLPDNILQIPHRSPLKDARTALRNHAANQSGEAYPCSDSKKSTDDTDDELLLSPGKKETPIRSSSNPKRSASPPPHDEYLLGSGSSERRDLKRAKRDLEGLTGNGEDTDTLKAESVLRERLTPRHTRNHSDPSVPPTTRRSARRRPATNGTKPISTVSASPPPSTPSTIPPKAGRAQSVPLFPSTQDIPRIDFRNPPPSPKRSRSPRSPSKLSEAKLRTIFTPFPTKTLPTIQDNITVPFTPMDLDDEPSSVCDEIEMEIPPASSILVDPIAPTGIGEPSSITVPAPPTSTTTIIPATPISRSLNKLIPLSPLTPLPETPLPPRFTGNAISDDGYRVNLGWGLPSVEETPGPSQPPIQSLNIPHAVAKSRLPRLPMSTLPVPSSKVSMNEPMGPPSLPAISKKAAPSTKSAISSTSKKNVGAAKDAFAMLMKRPREEMARRDKEKASQREMKPPTPAFTSHPVGKGGGSSSQGKIKMKDKMRPKTKIKQEKSPHLTLLSDEDEDEDEEDVPAESDAHNHTEAATEELPVTPTKATLQFIEQPRSTPKDVEMEIATVAEVGNTEEKDIVDTPMPEEEATANEGNSIPTMPAEEANSNEGNSVPTMTEEEASTDDGNSFPTTAVIETVTPEIASVAPENETSTENPGSLAGPSEPPSTTQDHDEKKADEPALPTNAGPSKTSLGKKRQPTAVPHPVRVTRSISNSKKIGIGAASSTILPPPKKPSKAPAFVATKRTASGVAKKPAETAETKVTDSSDKLEEQPTLPPGSPMKLASPAKSSKPISPKKTPKRFTFSSKPASSPSPSKIARSSSLFSSKPSSSFTARTFSMAPSQVFMGSSSSLSTLSNALEKLRMPAPSRPSTSMGFNRDAPSDLDDAESTTRSKDDVGVGRNSVGLGRPEGVKRATTLGADAFKVPNAPASSSSKAGNTTGKNLVQKPLSMFMSNKGVVGKTGASNFLRGSGRTSIMGNRPIFGVGGAARRTISKKTTLPMVVGSPVKGGGAAEATMQEEQEEEEDNVITAKTLISEETTEDITMAAVPRDTSTLLLEDLEPTNSTDKGKGKEKDYKNISRRVSMVSHALSQSLSAIPPPPPPPTRGLMGPPATPPGRDRSPKRSTSSSYPYTSAGGSSPSQPGPTVGTRASARIAKTAPALMKIRGGTDGHVASGRKGAAEAVPPPNPAVEALKVLKDCVIFVDVKTDGGDEAGSLFVEMLEGVGARVLTRVGQTCTHIVYKNGLTSTLNRYRLLRDPKPIVVGIAWVVECVEQRKRVDETEFLVDLDGVNVAGVNKRRRSMLPKSFMFADESEMQSEVDREDEGDRSMDGSTSSLMGDDDLAPLERARRRKSIMVGRP